MKKLVLLSFILFAAPAFAYPPDNSEADFLYNRGNHNTPVVLNYSNGHTYTKGVNDTYIRDDGVQYRKNHWGTVEASNGKYYMQIVNPSNPNDTYYVRTK